jgi:hypothetical protein
MNLSKPASSPHKPATHRFQSIQADVVKGLAFIQRHKHPIAAARPTKLQGSMRIILGQVNARTDRDLFGFTFYVQMHLEFRQARENCLISCHASQNITSSQRFSMTPSMSQAYVNASSARARKSFSCSTVAHCIEYSRSMRAHGWPL